MEVGTAAQRIAHGLFPEHNVSDVAEGHHGQALGDRTGIRPSVLRMVGLLLW